MNGEFICETMLRAYKDLEKTCAKIEERSLKIALHSRNADVYEVAETLIKLNNEKIAYCNVKVIMDRAFKRTGEAYELKQYYFCNKKIVQISEQIEVCEKTVCRRIKRQRADLFNAILIRYSAERLFDIICDSKWLINTYTKINGVNNEGNKSKFTEGH